MLIFLYQCFDVLIAGDFNSFDTCFLERDFGLQQMVTTVTHGSKIIDKVFC